MKKSFLLALLFALPAAAKVRVVATVGDLGAIARAVGGDAVDVETLARPTQDPHFVDSKPSLVLSLSRADLLLLIGLDLEVGWLPVVLTSSRNPRVQHGAPGFLDCSTLVAPKDVPLEKLDRSMGDIHPGGNPHFTTDPTNALKIAAAVTDRLIELDGEHAAAYRANAKKFSEALTARIAEWNKALAPYRGQPIVTYHKSWVYFSDWAGLDMVAFVEPKPGIPPNPAHVSNVLRVIRERKVPIILQEEWYSAQTSELLARTSAATLVRVPGMASDNESYADHFAKIVSAVVAGLASHG